MFVYSKKYEHDVLPFEEARRFLAVQMFDLFEAISPEEHAGEPSNFPTRNERA